MFAEFGDAVTLVLVRLPCEVPSRSVSLLGGRGRLREEAAGGSAVLRAANTLEYDVRKPVWRRRRRQGHAGLGRAARQMVGHAAAAAATAARRRRKNCNFRLGHPRARASVLARALPSALTRPPSRVGMLLLGLGRSTAFLYDPRYYGRDFCELACLCRFLCNPTQTIC